MAAYWEIAGHTAYDMFSIYKYLIGNYVFLPRFLGLTCKKEKKKSKKKKKKIKIKNNDPL